MVEQEEAQTSVHVPLILQPEVLRAQATKLPVKPLGGGPLWTGPSCLATVSTHFISVHQASSQMFCLHKGMCTEVLSPTFSRQPACCRVSFVLPVLGGKATAWPSETCLGAGGATHHRSTGFTACLTQDSPEVFRRGFACELGTWWPLPSEVSHLTFVLSSRY